MKFCNEKVTFGVVAVLLLGVGCSPVTSNVNINETTGTNIPPIQTPSGTALQADKPKVENAEEAKKPVESQTTSKPSTKVVPKLDTPVVTDQISTPLPSEYTFLVTPLGGVGSRKAGRLARESGSGEFLEPAKNWGTITFNASGDVVWSQCRSGYTLTKCIGNLGSDVWKESGKGCGLKIVDIDYEGYFQEMVITCLKN